MKNESIRTTAFCITAEIQCSTAYCIVSKRLFGKSNASASLCVFLSCAMMHYSVPFGFKMEEEIFGAFRLPLPLPTESEKVVCFNNAWKVEHFPRNCQQNCQEENYMLLCLAHPCPCNTEEAWCTYGQSRL
jgi:hypothetical protein